MKKLVKKETLSFIEFLEKIESMKNDGGVDLSVAEDASIAVMNLISLEEHFFFTAMKTGKDEYLDISAEIRSTRKDLLRELMPHHEGETWCASKHLLSATMRLIEVGNKLQSERKQEDAKRAFKRAYEMYSIFWGIKVKLLDLKNIADVPKQPVELRDIVSALADCCKE